MDKYGKLLKVLKQLDPLCVALSGGTDSTFLLSAAVDAGIRVLAVTVDTALLPSGECAEAAEYAKLLGCEHVILKLDVLKYDDVTDNPKNRCYFCKKHIFENIIHTAESHGITNIADGTNASDLGDYRPGLLALSELGVHSPLKEAGLTKPEIRELAQKKGLKNADRPSNACLASRIPYGTKITLERLLSIDGAEKEIRRLGFSTVRVRHYGELARLEVGDLEKAVRHRDELISILKNAGFKYATLDLEGFRSGSMNK